MEEKGLSLKRIRSKPYPAETLTDIDNKDDLALLANTAAQAESLLYSLDQPARDGSLLDKR